LVVATFRRRSETFLSTFATKRQWWNWQDQCSRCTMSAASASETSSAKKPLRRSR
jgi:hypothetical protein